MRFLALLALVFAGCGTTGSALVSFKAAASGPTDATGGPLPFSYVAIPATGTTPAVTAQVTLTKAALHVGAVYLNQSVPLSGAGAEPCILPGIYVAQAFGSIDVDLLSPEPQPFPVQGEGTQTEAKTAEVWLTGGDVNAQEDPTVILDVAGTAVEGGQTYPFSGIVTIGSNRAKQATNPAAPGANPICRQRIVTPILVDITPTEGGMLALQIDPRPMFNNVDFSASGALKQVSSSPPQYQIPDSNTGAGKALYAGMFASSGIYQFTWKPAGQ